MNVLKVVLKIFGVVAIVFATILGVCKLIIAISERKHKHT